MDEKYFLTLGVGCGYVLSGVVRQLYKDSFFTMFAELF